MESPAALLWDGFERQPSAYYGYNFGATEPACTDLGCTIPSPVDEKFIRVPQGPQYEVQISIQELLCNRLQWYYVTCKFVSPQGTPCCVGHPITFDSRIVFRDGRRRNSQRSTENDLILNLWGTCASSGQEVRKCSRCIEKDKVLTQRKRKRDTNLVWNESDDESNARLIQVLSSGNEIVDSAGEVKFRIRIGCCVGVNKQHHLNHVSNPDNTVEMHKGCPGLTLSLTVSEKGQTVASVASQPLRILGKVTTADRKKFGPAGETSTSSGLSSSTSSQTQMVQSHQSMYQAPLLTQQQTQQNIPKHLVQQPLSHVPQPQHSFTPKMPGTPAFSSLLDQRPSEFMSEMMHSSLMNSGLPDPTSHFAEQAQVASNAVASSTLLCQAVDYYLQVDPYEKLYELALAFRDSFGTIFSTSIPLFSNTFFAAANLRSIPDDSSVMLQLYVIVAIGACIKSQPKLAETLVLKATELSTVFLSNKKVLSDVDSLLVADSLNLIGCYYSSLGDLTKAMHYNKEAYQLLEGMATNGKPQLLNTNAYGNTVWSRLTFNMNIATLENGFEWAKLREKQPMMAYSLCLLISALCTPDHFFKGTVPLEEHLHRLLLDLFTQLEGTIEKARYRDVREGNRTYRKLVDYGLASMKFWLMGNYTQAGEYIEETAIQAALITTPTMESFVPLYLASFVSLQLSQKSQGWSSGITWPEWSTVVSATAPTSLDIPLPPSLVSATYPTSHDDSSYNRLG